MQTRPAHYNTRYKHDLTPKQTAVLDLMAEGRTNAEIAERLGLTLDGAKWHVREILGKLGMESREEAVAWWRSYRRSPARMRRGAVGLFAWLPWKVAAVGGSVVVAVAAAGLGFLLWPGGDGAQAFTELPACKQENIRSETTTETVDGVTRYTYALTLRDPDWYEGFFRTFRLSDRKVDSPCRLDTTAKVQVGVLRPIPDWPAERGPAPLNSMEPVEAEPEPFPEVRLRTPLSTGATTAALVIEIENWCQQPGETLGVSILVADMSDPRQGQGLFGPIDTAPPCVDTSRATSLRVSAVDSTERP